MLVTVFGYASALARRPLFDDARPPSLPALNVFHLLVTVASVMTLVVALGVRMPSTPPIWWMLAGLVLVAPVLSLEFRGQRVVLWDAIFVIGFLTLPSADAGALALVVALAVAIFVPRPSWERSLSFCAGNLSALVIALAVIVLVRDRTGAITDPPTIAFAVVTCFAVTTLWLAVYGGAAFRLMHEPIGELFAPDMLQAQAFALGLQLPFAIVGAMVVDAWRPALLLLFAPYAIASFMTRRKFALSSEREQLLEHLLATNQRIARGNLQFAVAMVRALDARDSYTANHSAAVAAYAFDIAFESGCEESTCRTAHLAGILHDIGKIGVPERVLNKSGRLTDEEFEQMRRHASIGAGILKEVEAYGELSVLVRHHHERIDGKGYPDRLRWMEIPDISRMIAVADTYSALTTDRPYRDGMDADTAIAILRDAAGSQLDPDYVTAFIRVLDHSDRDYRHGRIHRFEHEMARHGMLAPGVGILAGSAARCNTTHTTQGEPAYP